MSMSNVEDVVAKATGGDYKSIDKDVDLSKNSYLIPAIVYIDFLRIMGLQFTLGCTKTNDEFKQVCSDLSLLTNLLISEIMKYTHKTDPRFKSRYNPIFVSVQKILVVLQSYDTLDVPNVPIDVRRALFSMITATGELVTELFVLTTKC